MSETTASASTIITSTKGLYNQLLPDEQPHTKLPAIWDGGQQQHSETCDIIITDQRLIGYYYRSFPREKTFFDALRLAAITRVAFREKEFSPIFREILVTAGERKIYIRTPKQKAEELYAALRSATSEQGVELAADAESVDKSTTTVAGSNIPSVVPIAEAPRLETTPLYERQVLPQHFDRSPLAITILFTGGLFLEILGAVLWATTHSSPIGLPLLFAGFVAVAAALLIRYQKR